MTAVPELPDGFLGMVAPLLGNDLALFTETLDGPYRRGIRFHPEKRIIPPSGTLERIPWARDAHYLLLRSMAGSHPLHDAGAYYLQEPSAMAPAAALPLKPGDRVLDLCAAPGGKSTQIAARMEGGILVCNDPVPSRAMILSRNIERMAVKNAVVVSAAPEALAGRWQSFFDAILVDAPCSGEGMFRRYPESRSIWNRQMPEGCAVRQLFILRQAAAMLKPGGQMVYSTCTFNRLENEGVIEKFLACCPEFAPVPFALPGIPPYQDGMLRVWPHKTAGEGHFIALLRKSPDAAAGAKQYPAPCQKPGSGELVACGALLRDFITDPPVPNAVFAKTLVLAPPDCPPLDKIKVYRLGLHIGELRGKIFIPGHALALAAACVNVLPLDEKSAERYQRGEALACPETLRGYAAAMLDGLPLGFGKASNGEFKNHYPKGLRKTRAGFSSDRFTPEI
jgi:16S rRNA C967 or C1407 C5-methylase (RsmB/RsmF family)/NOL1/NOP2/fmu family ribosome biogenesis protein